MLVDELNIFVPYLLTVNSWSSPRGLARAGFVPAHYTMLLPHGNGFPAISAASRFAAERSQKPARAGNGFPTPQDASARATGTEPRAGSIVESLAVKDRKTLP